MKPRQVMIVMTTGFILSSPHVFADEMQTSTPTAATSAAPSSDVTASVQIIKMVLCQDVKDREPVQELNMTKVGDAVVGWTQVQSSEDTTLTQRWIHEGETVSDIPLQVKGGSPYRTWSRKTISEPGNWKWQVLDSKGKMLKEVTFTAAS